MRRLWPAEESIAPALDAKSALQEWLQAKGYNAPSYVLLETEGPPHNRVFTAQVNAQGLPPFCGKGKTKRQAEQQAAEQALAHAKGSGGSACG